MRREDIRLWTRSAMQHRTSCFAALFQNGVVHRDLKLENILLDQDLNVKVRSLKHKSVIVHVEENKWESLTRFTESQRKRMDNVWEKNRCPHPKTLVALLLWNIKAYIFITHGLIHLRKQSFSTACGMKLHIVQLVMDYLANSKIKCKQSARSECTLDRFLPTVILMRR